MSFHITVLVENTAGKNRTSAEHGLSFLIEAGDKTFLMDTGQGMVLQNNLDRLGVELNTVDALILSHGHYDHTGGMDIAAEGISPFRVYAHPKADEPKFARNADGSARCVGMTEKSRQIFREKATLIPVEKPTELGGGLWLTGPVPRRTTFEDTGGAFFLDEACTQPDELIDDQSAFFETDQGTVVILGCAHSGVINTLNYISELTDNRQIHTLIGGTHLINANANRIDRTVMALKKLNLQKIYPCHCTGFPAAALLWNEFPNRCAMCPVGTVITFKTQENT